jgi:putative transposase
VFKEQTKKQSVTASESAHKHKALKHYNTPGHVHELTFCCYHRYDYLGDATACELFLSELERCRAEHDFKLWAYVLMPNHVHLLIWPCQNIYDIARILNDTKGRIAKQYRDCLLEKDADKFKKFLVLDKSKNREVFRFWQTGGGFDRNLWNGWPISLKMTAESHAK